MVTSFPAEALQFYYIHRTVSGRNNQLRLFDVIIPDAVEFVLHRDQSKIRHVIFLTQMCENDVTELFREYMGHKSCRIFVGQMTGFAHDPSL